MTEHNATLQAAPERVDEPALYPLSVFGNTLARELKLALRRPANAVNPLFFMVVVVSLFPLAVSPLPETLQAIGPGVVWVAALLASLLPLPALFGQDFDDGTLELHCVSGQSLIALCFAKTVGLWIVAGLPIVLVSALVASTYSLPANSVPTLAISLALGTFALAAMGGVAAALTVGVARSSALISLLVLPLMIPVIIFGTRAVSLAASGEPVTGVLYLLAAVSVFAGVLAPFASAMALKVGLE